MTAETLRRAAALMRERAEAATGSPWRAVEGASFGWWVERPHLGDVALDLHGENARHIASWHPTVALAVAEWLEDEAERIPPHATHALTGGGMEIPIEAAPAVILARLYLGENESFRPERGDA